MTQSESQESQEFCEQLRDYQPEPDFSLDSDQKRKVYPCLNCSTDVLIYHGRGTQCPKEGL